MPDLYPPQYFAMLRPPRGEHGHADFTWLAIGGPWPTPEPARKLVEVMSSMATPRSVEFVAVGEVRDETARREKEFILQRQKRIEFLLHDYHSSRGGPDVAEDLLDALDDWLGKPTSIPEGSSR